jgi:histidinol phosphatase-like enzyme (inositol monophosphatase family)
MTASDLPHFAAFAEDLADAARAAILPYFRARHSVTDKGADRFDPVTEADEAAERQMRALIAARFPDHGVLGEEFGASAGASPYQWIIDPIDGTRAFIAGLPTWGVLIALAYEGRPVLGIMDQPYLDERYRGHVWNGASEATATIRGVTRPLRTRACATLANAIVCTTDPYLFEGEEAAAFARVRGGARLTRYGLDCTAYAMVAAGFVDGVYESGLKPFDIAALIPIIAGAGGGVCAWDGAEASKGGRVIAYGDARVRDELIRLSSV